MVAVDAVLLIGAAGGDLGVGPGGMGVAVVALDLSLVGSSLLLGRTFAARGRRRLAALFFANLGVFAVAACLRASGYRFRPAVLFAADLYWLTLYVACLAKFGREIAGTGLEGSMDRAVGR